MNSFVPARQGLLLVSFLSAIAAAPARMSLTLGLSDMSLTYTEIEKNYLSGSKQVVFPFKDVNWTLPQVQARPMPFDLKLGFATPYAYSGNQGAPFTVHGGQLLLSNANDSLMPRTPQNTQNMVALYGYGNRYLQPPRMVSAYGSAIVVAFGT